MSVSHDNDDPDSAHQQIHHNPMTSFIEPVTSHRPTLIHRVSSAFHRIPAHHPEYAKLHETFATVHAGHYDVSRWHHHLHPRVIKECARNALPHNVGHFIHPSMATLSRISRDNLQHIRNMSMQFWTSRNQRKHRYVPYSPHTERSRYGVSTWQRLANMRRIEYWNVSWWVAQAFTWGSVVWCVNGFVAWLPFVQTQLSHTLIATGWTAFVGATIFEIGSILSMLEAWNRDDTASFGWSIRSAVHHKPGEVLIGSWGNLTNPSLSDESTVTSASDVQNEKGFSGRTDGKTGKTKGESSDSTEGSSSSSGSDSNGSSSNTPESTVNGSGPTPGGSSPRNQTGNGKPSIPPPVQRIPTEKPQKRTILQLENVEGEHRPRRWIWFSLDPHYFYELGFLAAFFQFGGATIFWISGFTAIPSIQEALLRRVAAWKGAFWVPQVVGGSGFIISASFIMLESQEVWYKPELLSLGWHVGFWNFVGGIGFTVCGALGYFSLGHSRVAYQSALCTFWGSWAFLIGSVIQWYESVNAV
ncbi:hypothetical protein CVT24_006656 [Panaeolus cyanescens]|uniref:Integral membrane protein n=1 Tax=Panaeolus cyanescens TaxID=181874 RepID=A0A409YSE9_9AGAR|nr:hypothetical protein CVT24_006656 [Panaeolus cyanescens]